MAAILRDGIPEPRFDLQDLLVAQSYALLTGGPKGFKTWLALAWAICMAMARQFAGLRPTGDHRILFVEAECWQQIPGRFEKLCHGLDVDPYEAAKRIEFFKPKRRLLLETEAHASELRQRAQDCGATWTMIDSFVRIHGLDENVSRDMALLANVGLLPMKEQAGSGLLMVDHTPKSHFGRQRVGGEQVRGNTEKLAAADAHLDVDVHKQAGQRIVVVNVESNRLAPEREHPLYLILGDTGQGARFEITEPPDKPTRGRKPDALERAKSVIAAEKLRHPDIAFKRAVAAVVAEGISERTATRAWKAVQALADCQVPEVPN